MPAGLAAGLLAWLAAGGPGASAKALEGPEDSLRRLRSPRAVAWHAPQLEVAGLAAAPIFPMTTGPAAIPEPAVRLDGVVRSRRRVGALVAINDGPAEWMSVGDIRDGVALLEVTGAAVTVDTVFGPQPVRLGERIGPPPGAAAAPPPAGASGGAMGQTIVDEIPPGFRQPTPPASAPAAGSR